MLCAFVGGFFGGVVFFFKLFSCIGSYGKAKKRYDDGNDCCQYFPRWIKCAKSSERKNQLRIRNIYSDFT